MRDSTVGGKGGHQAHGWAVSCWAAWSSGVDFKVASAGSLREVSTSQGQRDILVKKQPACVTDL